MEFEKDETINDEQRILAQTRQVTLQPLDPFLKPEDAPDPIVMNETHGNIDRDNENTAQNQSVIQPSQGVLNTTLNTPAHHSFKIVLIAISLVTGIAAGAAFFVFLG
jgi:hypothetical protein